MEIWKKLELTPLEKEAEYRDARLERMGREAGAFVVDGIQIASTLQCCHCGGHFVSFRGSGARRVHCGRCNAITCGNPACDACVPFEKWLETVEKTAKWQMTL